jgi:IS30 family transposase
MPVQPVDATPPGINLSSKGGVLMHTRRWKLSAEQRADMWSRWKAGESLHAIGRALGKEHHVIHFLLARHGGIAPAARRRSPRVLTLAEREDISRGIASGCSMRVIAQRLSRASSTVSREVARHGGRAPYRANDADQQAWESAWRPKTCLLAGHGPLRELDKSPYRGLCEGNDSGRGLNARNQAEVRKTICCRSEILH